MRIAVLDDDLLVLELLKAITERIGYLCHTFSTAEQWLQTLRCESFDLMVVDWHLPDMDGPDVVRATRTLTGMSMPILFVTRRQHEQDIVDALASGADDFMSKPVRVAEFSARVKALVRRAYPAARETEQVFGNYRFDDVLRNVAIDGVPVTLTDREYALALLMFQNSGRLLSREHLRERIWGQIHEVPSRTIDTHISRLRTKLRLGAQSGYRLMAIYGLGYRLELTDNPTEDEIGTKDT